MAEPDEIRPIPDAAEAALSPEDTKTNDQLYLTGLHLEQYQICGLHTSRNSPQESGTKLTLELKINCD